MKINLICCIFCIFFILKCNGMKIYEICPDLFSTFEGVEYYSYLELKNNPLPINVNYLAVPWHQAAISNKLGQIKNALKNVHLKRGFTILYGFEEKQSDQIIQMIKGAGIDCIFTPRASTQISISQGMKVISYPYYPANGVDPSQIKDILYSFIGIFWSHPVRKKLALLNNPPLAIVQDTKDWFSNSNLNKFQDTLARSRFSLCPRGYAPNSVRFWESLQAGAIPLLISDTALLPEGFDWDACCIRVAEKDVEKIPDIIKQISSEQEEAMRQACYVAHQMFSGHNLISPIKRYYGIPTKNFDENRISDDTTYRTKSISQETSDFYFSWATLD